MSIGEVLQALANRAQQENTSFLLVGGWALNAHGVSRQTLDVGGDDFRTLRLTYGTKALYEEIVSALS